MRINIPVPWAVEGYGVPDVCAAHGRPATPRRVAVSASPSWAWIFLLVGVITFFLVRALFTRTLVLPAWPICDRCQRARWTAFKVSGALVLLGLAALAAPSVVEGAGPLWVPIGLLVVLAGLLALVWTPWASVARVRVDEELAWITVIHPHPEFEARFVPFEAELQEELRR